MFGVRIGDLCYDGTKKECIISGPRYLFFLGCVRNSAL